MKPSNVLVLPGWQNRAPPLAKPWETAMATSAWSSTTGSAVARRLDRPAGGRGARATSRWCWWRTAWAASSRRPGRRFQNTTRVRARCWWRRAMWSAKRCARCRQLVAPSCRPAVCQRALASRNDPYCAFERARLFAALGRAVHGLRRLRPHQRRIRPGRAGRGHVLLQDLDERLNRVWSPRNPRASAADSKPCLAPRSMNGRRKPAAQSWPAGVAAADRHGARQYQPRTRMDEGALYELAESIKAQGIMQPILVRLSDDELAARRRRPTPASTKSSPASGASARGWPGWTVCRCWCAMCRTKPPPPWR